MPLAVKVSLFLLGLRMSTTILPLAPPVYLTKRTCSLVALACLGRGTKGPAWASAGSRARQRAIARFGIIRCRVERISSSSMMV